MRKQHLLALLVLFAALLLGGVAFFFFYRDANVPACCRNHSVSKDMAWLQHEYHLSSAQLERIQQLHADHARLCAERCKKIAIHRAQLATLLQQNHEITPAISEKIKTVSTLEWECRQATIAYIYSVAAAMSPEDGVRYINTMASELLPPCEKGKSPCGNSCGSCGSCEMSSSR